MSLFSADPITLHSYRYAWAERARTCGYPERFAQEALGHNSKAIHRAYAESPSPHPEPGRLREKAGRRAKRRNADVSGGSLNQTNKGTIEFDLRPSDLLYTFAAQVYLQGAEVIS